MSDAQHFPKKTRLVITWAILMALTALSLTAAEAGQTGATAMLGFGAVALILGVAFFKMMQILWVYLNLRRSSTGWQSGLAAFLLLLCSLIGTAYALSLHTAG